MSGPVQASGSGAASLSRLCEKMIQAVIPNEVLTPGMCFEFQ